ncbi:helix-turn-helix domain-containing protein [Winogradskyella ursingii]|uniref:helix-turn-helix domain-containing protein n=1 Tax=Winogradskyella ursingii TaxID=2686079 RepID=UPI0015CCEC79|nr:AraC family transcriptional regulator [Winogradskyella ursingii]
MITLNTNSQNLDTFFRTFSKKIEGNFSRKINDYSFSFNNKIGNGTINGTALNGSYIYIEYDVNFNQDVRLGKKMVNPNHIYFIYSLKGVLSYEDSQKQIKNDIREFRTCIYASETSSKAMLTFKKGVQYKVAIITVMKNDGPKLTHAINNRVFDYFKNRSNTNSFSHIGSFNLRIAEKIERLNKIKTDTIENTLLFQGNLQIILSLQLKQYKEDLDFQKNKTGSLTIREIKCVRALSQQIKENPELPKTIKEMCQESGLSPCKLQEAFKLLYQKTANDFIRNERLKMAEKLISKNELNISEVVYTIGLSSRSYFSRIFKEKYGLTPKSYQDTFTVNDSVEMAS